MIKQIIRKYLKKAVGCHASHPRSECQKKIISPELQEIVCKVDEYYGFAVSCALKRPVAADGRPIPWYTYPAIEYFNQWDVRGINIFEYSSGNSSLYWAERGANVYSVEHDPNWYKIIFDQSSSLKSLVLCEDKDRYTNSIHLFDTPFDIIVIDGVWRNECAIEALSCCKEHTVIILDNSDWYTDVASILRSKGYFQIDWSGFGPINTYAWTTSLFLPYKSQLMARVGSPVPICGTKTRSDEIYW